MIKFIDAFPIKWKLVEDDAPGWEAAWELIDLEAVNEDEEASNAFHDEFNNYSYTKVGGFPEEIQSYVELENFVFQIGSEEKARWNWVDSGTAYFHKDKEGTWTWDCQFF